jgi:hypothetical protein
MRLKPKTNPKGVFCSEHSRAENWKKRGSSNYRQLRQDRNDQSKQQHVSYESYRWSSKTCAHTPARQTRNVEPKSRVKCYECRRVLCFPLRTCPCLIHSRGNYTGCFIILFGISEVCSSETNSPTGDESMSVKRVNNQVFFLCLVPWLSYPFHH